jgi:hypothetical protein
MKVKLIHSKDDPVRLSFPNLFKPVAFKNADGSSGNPRYDATYLVKPDGENAKRIREAIVSVAKDKFGADKYEKVLKAIAGNSNKMCYLDGDTKDYDGYEGMRFLACHRKEKDGPPYVCDQNRNELSERSGKPYAGCYVNATVDIYAQEGQYQGIRAGIIGVQFVSDGDAFGGSSRGTAEDFDDLACDGGAASGEDSGPSDLF